MPTVAVAGNMVYGQTVALIFTNSDSGEDYITVDGNEGDQYVLHTSLSDSCVHFQPVTTLLLGTMA
jgi:hypothetical protein